MAPNSPNRVENGLLEYLKGMRVIAIPETPKPNSSEFTEWTAFTKCFPMLHSLEPWECCYLRGTPGLRPDQRLQGLSLRHARLGGPPNPRNFQNFGNGNRREIYGNHCGLFGAERLTHAENFDLVEACSLFRRLDANKELNGWVD